MAVIQISRIQHRRGLAEDLPQLSSAELGWCTDTRRLYIGNGTSDELSPNPGGRTELLTEFSILDFEQGFAANITTLEGNIATLEGNITTLESAIASISTSLVSVTLPASSTGSITDFAANNVTIMYTLTQDTVQRTGTILVSADASSVSFEDNFNDTGTTDIELSVTGTSTTCSLDYTTTTETNFSYRVSSLS